MPEMVPQALKGLQDKVAEGYAMDKRVAAAIIRTAGSDSSAKALEEHDEVVVHGLWAGEYALPATLTNGSSLFPDWSLVLPHRMEEGAEPTLFLAREQDGRLALLSTDHAGLLLDEPMATRTCSATLRCCIIFTGTGPDDPPLVRLGGRGSYRPAA